MTATIAAPAAARIGPLLAGAQIAPDRETMVPVPGGRAYVRVNGDLAGERPPVVLLHGGPGSAHWYFLNATALASERAVILYDQLDSGRSDHPGAPANWTVPRFVAELEAIRAHLGVSRWHVLGASWGGTVALEYGAARPPALASLVLQSPLVSTAAWLRDARLLLERCERPGMDAASCAAAHDAFYARHVHLADPPPAIAAYKAALPRSFSDDVYRYMWGRAEFSCTGTLKGYDGTALLARIDGARTLFVAGEHDEARPATLEAFAGLAHGARYATVPDAAHSIMNDNAAAYLALLRPWLAEHDA